MAGNLDLYAARAKASLLDPASDIPSPIATMTGCHDCANWTRLRGGSPIGACGLDNGLKSYAHCCPHHVAIVLAGVAAQRS